MPALNGFYCNRGETRRGEQEFVYYKKGFNTSLSVLSKEFLMTTKNTTGQDIVFFNVYIKFTMSKVVQNGVDCIFCK